MIKIIYLRKIYLKKHNRYLSWKAGTKSSGQLWDRKQGDVAQNSMTVQAADDLTPP